MSLSKFGTITAIALLTFISSSLTTGILPGRSIQVLAQTQDNRQAEAERLFQQGLEQYQTSQFQAALQSFQQALEIYREIGDRAGEGLAIGGMGVVYDGFGQYEQALNYYQQALAIAQETNDQGSEGTLLNNIGLVYSSLGQYEQALNYHQQALAIAQETNDRRGEGISLNSTGLIYTYIGQYNHALDYLYQALSIAQGEENRIGEGRIFNTIAEVHLNIGQHQQALNYYQQALSIAQETGDRIGEGAALSSAGVIHRSLGQYQQALQYYQQGLSIAQETGNQMMEGVIHSNIGVIQFTLRQYSQAIAQYQQALSIAQEIGDRVGEGVALNGIGAAYIDRGQYLQGLEYYQQALIIAQEVGDRSKTGRILNNLGHAYVYLEQYPQALEYLRRSLAIQRELGDRIGEGNTLSNIGVALFRSGQLISAETALLDALAILDTLRQQDLTDADKISLFDTHLGIYQGLQQVQIAQNNMEAALETSERGRSRPFVALLSQRIQGIDAITNLPIPSIGDIQQTSREQTATLVQYSIIYTDIAPPAIYIWVIKPTGAIAFRSVTLNEENQQHLTGAIATAFSGNPIFRGDNSTISNLISNVRPTDRSASRDIEFEYNPSVASDNLRQLHQLLIEPIADLLPTNESDRIVFIPQGGLFLVPFAALQDANGDYLIEHHTISIAPSIQILDLTRQQRQPDRALQNALVVGNPVMPEIWNTQTSTEIPLAPLPGAEREAEAIAQFLNTEALIGNAATETAVAEQMPEAQIIHLATHGLLEYGIPSESGVLDVPGAIALTPDGNEDGLLTSAEILEMNLRAELVVLSACDTGQGRITGDGVVGLSRAFISAGVPSVIVSLWSVPDAPTANLMTEFYRQLETQPDKAQALRQAMLVTMQQHPDPRDWAAFILVGETQ